MEKEKEFINVAELSKATERELFEISEKNPDMSPSPRLLLLQATVQLAIAQQLSVISTTLKKINERLELLP